MSAWIWLIGGGFALGACILAMHFVGMLVMDHAMNMRFDPFLTGFSMPIALDSPLFALWLISAEKLLAIFTIPPIHLPNQYMIPTPNNIMLVLPDIHSTLTVSHRQSDLAFLIRYRLTLAPAYKDHNLRDSLTSSLLFR